MYQNFQMMSCVLIRECLTPLIISLLCFVRDVINSEKTIFQIISCIGETGFFSRNFCATDPHNEDILGRLRKIKEVWCLPKVKGQY
jgi:hypothetical protein